MAYIVQELTELYDQAPDDEAQTDTLGKWLSMTEQQGYRVVGVVPDHRSWDSEGKSLGSNGALLILHKEGDA